MSNSIDFSAVSMVQSMFVGLIAAFLAVFACNAFGADRLLMPATFTAFLARV